MMMVMMATPIMLTKLMGMPAKMKVIEISKEISLEGVKVPVATFGHRGHNNLPCNF